MKFTIVTPVYNGAATIADTFESILAQEGDFEIKYIVRDGGSTDGTMEIVRSYEPRFAAAGIELRAVSEKDAGMYDAVAKGFASSTGDIMAYINADDRYLPGAFAAVASALRAYPDIEWIKGVTEIDDGGGIQPGRCLIYRQDWLTKGIYGRTAPFVEQDSVFWRRSLWEKARPQISGFKLAGDYALWRAFAAHAPLWSLDRPVSVFRRRPGQLSADMAPYRKEQERIAPHTLLEKRVALLFTLIRILVLKPGSMAERALSRALFPLQKGWWYIRFDASGAPVKTRAASYIA